MSEERLILPYNARVEDLDQIAEYLRSRPTGATHSQIARTLGRKLTDDRKVLAISECSCSHVESSSSRILGHDVLQSFHRFLLRRSRVVAMIFAVR